MWDGLAGDAPASWSMTADEAVGPASHRHLLWLLRATTNSSSDTVRVEAPSAEAARRAVVELNNLAGEKLASWADEGGVARIQLSPRARRLSVALLALRAEQDRMLAQFGEVFAEDLRLLERLAVRTSARNQFAARVVSRPKGALREDITLELAGGQPIRVAVTRASVRALALRPGLEVVALMKASSLRLRIGNGGRIGLDQNRLPGQVAHVLRDGGRAEVAVDISGGQTAIALAEAYLADRLVPGQPVTLIFSPDAAIIGRVA